MAMGYKGRHFGRTRSSTASPPGRRRNRVEVCRNEVHRVQCRRMKIHLCAIYSHYSIRPEQTPIEVIARSLQCS